ncbi:MAG: CTP-dependent riboflavin kinase [Thaumarchaeota archaeon]|nr:CTP-dependent riboflavin kinase [Nitrososphaerota archaeon]
MNQDHSFRGRVFTGVGKGAYYVGNPGYKQSFLEKLGYVPFPGTLNLKLESSEDIERRKQLRLRPGIRIGGFEAGGETFSALNCFNGTMKGVRVTLLIIDITHYDDTVMELISPAYLRRELSLKDGDVVETRIEEQPHPK